MRVNNMKKQFIILFFVLIIVHIIPFIFFGERGWYINYAIDLPLTYFLKIK